MNPDFQQMIDDCKNELNDIELRLQTLSATDPCRKYLTNYSLIKACGTAEFVYRSIIADYFKKYASPQIDTYLENTIRNASSSAKYDNMKNLLDKFDKAWCDAFKAAVDSHIDGITHIKDGQRLISSSNSLVTNRHNFAHGKNPTAGFCDIKKYFYDVVTLIELLDNSVK